MESTTTIVAGLAWLVVPHIAQMMQRGGGAFALSGGRQTIDWFALAAFAVCVAVLGMVAPILACLAAGRYVLGTLFESIFFSFLVRPLANAFRTLVLLGASSGKKMISL